MGNIERKLFRKRQMEYRGLAFDKEAKAYKWVYGMPSYGYITEEITEIGTTEGDFHEVIPESIGERTGYTDRNDRWMYTGDIAVLEVDGERREFIVERATVDREYNTLPGFEEGTVKVRLSGVVVFRWTDPDGIAHQLLPCVDRLGVDDTALMEIIDTVAERAVRESESKGEKQ